MYRRGYFRQTIDADGHQEHAYPDFELSRLPILRAMDRLGRPPHRQRRAARPRAVRRRVGRPGRPGAGPAAGHGPPRQRRLGPADHAHPVRARPRDAPPPGARAGRGRRPRAAGARHRPAVWHLNEGHSAFLLAERAREQVAGGASIDDAWTTVSRNSVFTIHTPVSAGNERFDADLVRRVAGPLFEGDGRAAHRRHPARALLELGQGVDRDAQPVRHDGLLAAPDQRRQRRLASSTPTRPTAPGTGVAPHEILGHHQRRPHADLGRPADARASSSATPTRTSTPWTTSPRSAASGSGRRRSPTRAVGGAPAPEAGAGDLRPRPAAQPVRPPRRGARRPRGARGGPRPGDPHDRLRAPVRDVQARRRCCSATWTGSPGSCGTRIGRCRSSSPARPIRPTGPARA